ncbi:cupin domain-containing protein [Propionispora hippei]|uniref:Mannose-6-phosphate isomerase, cupin superfamily n=1 Tax=Propionispora hippei DSM 15287 TaxID=1123003 RepID=A0A1M6LB07_9FIRM|nr:cupin domain-containing protein [Propionispora hippei]SHJ68353.1 Mannose-6-phosphate isomerase, cupin superfamily [Propionispora hippei DSM 15287]
MEKVNIKEKLNLFNEYWSPRIIGEVNDSYVKIAKFKGDFIWHTHQKEDEMFYVLKGSLTIKFRDKAVLLQEGECIIIPRGIEHMPVADEEVYVMLIEPKATLNTGNIINDRTMETLEKI